MSKKQHKSSKAIKEEGRRAYAKGQDLEECPYAVASSEYEIWVEGWLEASEND